MGRLTAVGDFPRFPHPRELMAYLGLVPSEDSSGGRERRGAITKAGNTHARRILGRGRLALPAPAAPRERPGPPAARGSPRPSSSRRGRHSSGSIGGTRHLVGHGKRPPVAVVAVARELVGFVWAALTRTAAAQAA